MAVTTHIETLETLLQQWRPSLGEDYTAYRNHVYRVINHCIIYAKKNDITLSHGDIEIIAIAGAFHDIGIWLDHTFDYLKPSLQRANNYLVREGKNQWVELVSNMITEHHKITPRAPPSTPKAPQEHPDTTPKQAPPEAAAAAG